MMMSLIRHFDFGLLESLGFVLLSRFCEIYCPSSVSLGLLGVTESVLTDAKPAQ